MKVTRRIAVAALFATGAASGAYAQTAARHRDSTKSKHKEVQPTIATLQHEIEEMHNQLQSEIDLLKQQLVQRDAQLAAAQESAATANSRPPPPLRRHRLSQVRRSRARRPFRPCRRACSKHRPRTSRLRRRFKLWLLTRKPSERL